MISQKVLAFIASSIVCSILLIFGCARPAKEVSKTGVKGKETAKIKVEEPVKPEAKPEVTIKTEVKPEEAIKPQVPPEKEGPTVQLALKFAPEDLTTL